MNHRLWQSTLDSIATLVAPLRDNGAENDDTELLRRFRTDRDEAAFTALIRRHGPLIWGTCWAILRSDSDAEDAFQATCLVLFQQSQRVKSPAALGAWLHTVAQRVCRNQIRARSRRSKHETAGSRPEADVPVADTDWDRWQQMLHEEVEQLPETHRVAFVMCCLQGVPQPAAAAQLGWKPGTLTGRLSRAKQSLTDALSRRGVASVIGIGTMATFVPLSGPLLAKAMAVFSGPAGPAGAIPPAVLDLTHRIFGVLSMKAKILIVMAATVLVTGIGTQWSNKSLQAQVTGGPGGTPPGVPGGGPPGAGGPPPGLPGGGLGGGSSMGGMGGGMMGEGTGPGMGGGFGQSGSPRRWEYKFVSMPIDMNELNFNKLGDQGWEFLGMSGGTSPAAIFKRQKFAGGVIGGMGPGGLGGFGDAPGGLGSGPFGGAPPGMGGFGGGGRGTGGGGSGTFGGGPGGAVAAPVIEFRWAEDTSVAGVTDKRGVDLSCSNQPAFLHSKPVLTRSDIRQINTNKNGSATLLEVVLTDKGSTAMDQSSRANLNKPLVCLVDGKIVGAMVIKTPLSSIIPVLSSQTEADLTKLKKSFEAGK